MLAAATWDRSRIDMVGYFARRQDDAEPLVGSADLTITRALYVGLAQEYSQCPKG